MFHWSVVWECKAFLPQHAHLIYGIGPSEFSGVGVGLCRGGKGQGYSEKKNEIMVMLQCLQDESHCFFLLNSQRSTGFKFIYWNLGNNKFEWPNIYCENLFSWIASLQSHFLQLFVLGMLSHSVMKKSYDWSKIPIKIQMTICGKYFIHSTLIFMY